MKKFIFLILNFTFVLANESVEILHQQACDYLQVKDYKNAKIKFEKGVLLNDCKAMHNLGLMYINGHGVAKDYKKAMKYFKKALTHNYINSSYDIGVMYKNGEGVKKDFQKAKEYYLIAANNNYALAQFELSKVYGSEQNMEKFKYWATKAIENGYKVTSNNDKMIIVYLKSLKE